MKALFQKNITYFYEKLPHYYTLITSLKSRRFEIIHENGSNIYDKELKTFLFPFENGKHLMETITDTYANNPMQNPLWKKNYLSYTLHRYPQESTPLTSTAVNKLYDEAERIGFDNQKLLFDQHFLPTTVIFGMMGGRHIQKLLETYRFQSLFIYEPDVELFALSLYFIDYPMLYETLKERLFLFVKGELDTHVIREFYDKKIITSNFMRLEFTTYDHPSIQRAKEAFKLAGMSNRRGWGTFEDESVGLKNHFANLKSGRLLLSGGEKIGVPICVAASGKSLETSFEFIKENREKMILLSVGTALKPLQAAGIESDMHIEIERMPYLVEVLKEVLEGYEGIFIGASVIDQGNFSLVKESVMFIRDASSAQTKGLFSLAFASPIVGNAGVSLALLLSKEVYLCGMDAGFKQKESLHAQNSFYDDREDRSKEAIKVKGNLSPNIYSNSLFNLSRITMENAIMHAKANVYNLSDGALIKGAKPTYPNEIALQSIDKNEALKKIKGCFSKVYYEEHNLEVEIEVYKKAVIKIMERVPEDREALCEIFDKVTDFSHYVYQENRQVGTLMRGTLWHLLNFFYSVMHKFDMTYYETFFTHFKEEFNSFSLKKSK